VVIPVNLKIGYESTVLSRGETRKNQALHIHGKLPRTVGRTACLVNQSEELH
jgi:hypothetical protein